MTETVQKIKDKKNIIITKHAGVIAGILLAIYIFPELKYILQGYFSLYEIANISMIILSILLICNNKNNKITTVLLVINNAISIINLITYINGWLGWVLASIPAVLADTYLTILSFQTHKTQKRRTIQKAWFIPAIINIIYSIYYIFVDGILYYDNGVLYLLYDLIYVVSILFLGAHLVNRTEFEEDERELIFINNNSAYEDGYYELTTHVILLLFFGFIWNYIWIYKITKYLNKTPNEEYRDPTSKLLLCIFVPFYTIYWTYQSAKRIDTLAKNKNISSDIATLSLILSIFLGIVPPIIMQSKINQIAKADTTNNNNYTNVQQKQDITLGTADEIRKYKQLLDEGIITQEEFEIKKRQLLDI